jgi:hypothetical protein
MRKKNKELGWTGTSRFTIFFGNFYIQFGKRNRIIKNIKQLGEAIADTVIVSSREDKETKE